MKNYIPSSKMNAVAHNITICSRFSVKYTTKYKKMTLLKVYQNVCLLILITQDSKLSCLSKRNIWKFKFGMWDGPGGAPTSAQTGTSAKLA